MRNEEMAWPGAKSVTPQGAQGKSGTDDVLYVALRIMILNKTGNSKCALIRTLGLSQNSLVRFPSIIVVFQWKNYREKKKKLKKK